MKLKIFNKVRENKKFKLVKGACVFALSLTITTPFAAAYVGIDVDKNSILEDSFMLIEENPFVLSVGISNLILAGAVAMFVLSITESEIISESEYLSSIKNNCSEIESESEYLSSIKNNCSEIESEYAMQYIRLVNQIEIPTEIEESQKVLKKSM